MILAPQFNQNGVLAWMQMKRDGFEADKQDLIVLVEWQVPYKSYFSSR
jgi:hypothetical protein